MTSKVFYPIEREEFWESKGEVRWLDREDGTSPVLQQLFRGSRSGDVWKDVPAIKTSDEQR
jgi:hypothetical protein